MHHLKLYLKRKPHRRTIFNKFSTFFKFYSTQADKCTVLKEIRKLNSKNQHKI